jgi:hypothetical protein
MDSLSQFERNQFYIESAIKRTDMIYELDDEPTLEKSNWRWMVWVEYEIYSLRKLWTN